MSLTPEAEAYTLVVARDEAQARHLRTHFPQARVVVHGHQNLISLRVSAVIVADDLALDGTLWWDTYASLRVLPGAPRYRLTDVDA